MKANSFAAPTKPHRILISGGMASGGTQTHVMLLCRVLREAGAEVTLASASNDWPDEAIAEVRAIGVKIITSPFGFGAFRGLGKLTAFLLWPFLLRRDYDVLYCVGEGRMHLWTSRFASKRGWKIYHEIVECPRRDSVPAQVAVRMDALLANSRAVGEKMGRMFDGIPLRSIPFLTSSAAVPAPLGRPPVDTLRVAFLGRLAHHKRPELLIEAWPEWIARAPISPARLDIYGSDYQNEADRLQARITELGLENSVHIHGAYSTRDLSKIFAATDLVVLPSRYEGLPLVLVEAMQRGIPVVATAAGGTAELGDDNPDVIITQDTDWGKFAAGVEAMAARIRAGEIDPARLHEWTESRYGFARVADLWHEALLAPELFFANKTACPAAT